MVESKQEEQAPSYKKQLLAEMYAMEMEMERMAEIFKILMVEKILTCFYDKDLSSIDLISQRLCLEGSRRQANSALHALKTKSHVDISEEEKTHFPSVLQSMEPRAKEIGEFTAPEAACIDELVEDIFHLIVGTKRGLKDTSGPSVGRRVVILETPAKNRSCVVMLDLEYEDLVNEIFSAFFPVARLQQEMQKYLALRQMHQDGDAPEVQKKILHCFRILSRLFADPVKAEESFQFPDQLKDINIWKILTNPVDPNTGSPQACILLENATDEGVADSLLQLMVSSAAALGGAAAAVDMDAGLAEDADADLGGDEGVVIDNDDDGWEADDEVEGDVGDDNNDDNGGGHVQIQRITYDLDVPVSRVDPLGQPNAGALHQLVLHELSLHPLPGIDVPDGGYDVAYVLQAGNEQQRVDFQGLQNFQNPPWINLAGFIVSVEARDMFLPKFIPVSMANPNGDAQPMGTFDY